MTPEELKRSKFYQDLHRLPEDDRIRLIGHYVLEHGEKVTFLTDADPGKGERYV